MSKMGPMDITVNGIPAAPDPAAPLEGRDLGERALTDPTVLDLVRDGLGLTGTKLVCGTGVCGACTVLVDGTPAVACLTPCGAVEGHEITTVEGVGTAHPGGVHPVQRAFAAHDALQCGYCTPGFVVSAAAFVDRRRAEHGDVPPSRAEIAEAMAGHLCRCGAYEGIYAAVAAACAGKHDGAGDEVAPARVEAMEKLTGRAVFTADVALEGALEGVIVRSPRAHARIGTVAAGDPAGAALVDLLGDDRTVRYTGQPIAAVAAPTRAGALAAAAAVRVEYTPLPAALDPATADGPKAPAVYAAKAARQGAPRSNEAPLGPARWEGNVRGPSSSSWRGGTAVRRIAAARERGDERLVTGTYRTAVQAHTAMEPHACVARWDGGDLHLHVSTQSVAKVAEEAARRWRLEPSRVRVVAEHVGGGFGAKVGLGTEAVAAAELARACGAPVRVALTRAEEMTDGGGRPATRTEIALLADEDGGLAALAMDVHGDGGVSVGTNSAALARYMYGNAPRRLRDFDVLTHRPPGRPFRGPGGPPMAWALEQAVDEMAERLGEDPVALRRRWDGNPKRAHLYDWAAALPAWAERTPPGSGNGRFRRGVGLAAANWLYLLDPATEVELTVEDGTVVARTATQDIGTGSRSVVAGIVRAELGLPAERVRVELGRSGTVHGPASAASSGTPSVAPAARDAAARLRAALGVAEPRSVLAALDGAGEVRVVGRRRRDHRGYVTPFPLGGLSIGRGFAGAVNVTEVEVDTRLGTVRATRVWCGVAAGRVYEERLARSQCEGGVVQGIGYALYERRHDDPSTGVVLTDNLEDYHIPGIGDTPEISVHFHQDGWDHVTGRGVGLGEISTVAVAASVGSAVYNATGWRPHELPVRPDRLLEGIAR